MKQNVAMSFPTPSIANFDITVASSLKSYPEKLCHIPTLSLEIRIMHQKDDQQFAKLLNRLPIGKQRNDELRILQSRKVTQEQFETLHHIPPCLPEEK